MSQLWLSWEAYGPEDHFWRWAERELDGKQLLADPQPKNGDVVLRYATLGPLRYASAIQAIQSVGVCQIALLWELYPEMERANCGSYPAKIEQMIRCGQQSRFSVVPSELVASLYDYIPFFIGERIVVQPIGVDMDLFSPGYPPTASRVGLWCGTDHPMKGFDQIPWGIADRWIIVWKNERSRVKAMTGEMGRRCPVSAEHYTAVSQRKLAELMQRSSFYCVAGRLRPFFLVEYEAMACNLPIVICGEKEKDFIPSDSPRQQLIDMGWDRKDAKKAWLRLIDKEIA